MRSWMLALLLLANPDGGAATPAWSITYETSMRVDHGNGRTVGLETTSITATPTEVRQGTTARPLDPARRDAISALLPSLRKWVGTWSISPFVADEGSSSQTLSIVIGCETLTFHFVEGKSAPPLPDALARLGTLVLKP